MTKPPSRAKEDAEQRTKDDSVIRDQRLERKQ